MDGNYITIEGVMGGEKTWYVGDDIEFRQVGSSVEIIENVIGSDLVARRSHSQTVSDSVENQYFIKNHLGSTVALISKEGTPAGPVFDYFPYGKQKEEVVTPEKITQTFTGKEFDLFEQDTTSGDDGEGWYYFGVRYYDADIGLWTSCDPIEQHFNVYLYSGNNPVNRIDPDGMADYGSQDRYVEAAEAVVSHESLKPSGGLTYCNYGLEAIVDPGLENPVFGTANDITKMLENTEFASKITAAQATEYAQKGITPIAAWRDPKGGHGHVAAVAPTIDAVGRPEVYNIGVSSGKMGYTWAFGKSKRNSSTFGFYVLNEDLVSLQNRTTK